MKADPAVLARMDAVGWRYSIEDPIALSELRARIESCGKARGLISYSDLVAGMEFRLPSIQESPYLINVRDWSGLDRAIIGDFLGHISMDSYRSAAFMASALVVGKHADQPSEHFFDWMEQLRILPNRKLETVLKFWVEHVQLAHRYYMR